MSWTLKRPGPPGPGRVLVLTVDPVVRVLRFERVVVGAGDSAVAHRAVYRGPVDRVLDLTDRRALLDRVEAGFSHTTMWSGDVVGDWTEDAWLAAEELRGLCVDP